MHFLGEMQRRVGKVYNPDQLFVALAWLYWEGRERGLVVRIIGVDSCCTENENH